MDRRLRLATATGALALMALPQAAFAAGFSNLSQSATSTAMASIGAGNPDEPNASFYNPASMGFRGRAAVYVGDTVLLPSINFTSNGDDGVTETKFQVFPPPNFHLSVPFAERFAASVGVTFPFGAGVAWPDAWEHRAALRSQTLQTTNINPNVAYRLPGDKLSLAAGAQIYRATVVLERAITLGDDRDIDVKLGGAGMGFGANAALMYRPNDQFTMGLHYRSAVKLNFEGSAHFGDVEGTPFETSLQDQDITTSITLPHVVLAGFGYKPNKNLFLGFDVNYMAWSTYDEVVIDFAMPEMADSTIKADWHDAFAFRLGAQYDVTDNFAARLGVGYDMTPVPAETAGPSLPDGHRTVVSTGVGYKTGDLRLDLGYQQVFVAERVIDNGGADGTYEMGAKVIGLNAGYRF